MNLDDRKLMVLSAVVDEYIKSGEPVGSKTIITNSEINVSSATIRNDMSALEKMGFLEQPHTSAGRVPTYLGYRLYIEKLMHPQLLTDEQKTQIDQMLQGTTAQSILENAVEVLSDATQLAVINANNLLHFSVITKVEVIPAGRKLYALLMITSTGSIKNKICRLEFDLNHEQIQYFADFINKNGFTRYWDDEAKAPWLFNGERFISYDDEDSLSYKITWLKEQKLCGIMFWVYEDDGTHTLVSHMRRELDKESL